jgi:polyhydroxyalkanoate synthesis regulator phasin
VSYIIIYRDQFQSTFEEVEEHAQKINQLISNGKIQLDEGNIFLIDYIVRELFNNAVEHGNKFIKKNL